MSHPIEGTIIVSSEQLRALIAEVFAAARAPASDDDILDREALAKKLRCSTSQVDKLVAKGMPHFRFGCPETGSKRFVWTDVLEWLKGNER